jgi:hypothetical protein
MSTTTLLIILSIGLVVAAAFIAWQDHKIKNLEKDIAVLKNEIEHFKSVTHPG